VSDEATALAAFGYELGILKRMRRSGWWHAGVRDPESVAEHTMRVAQLAGLIAAEENADPAHAAYLAIWHDSQETRTGDLPHTIKGFVDKPDARKITAVQTAALPQLAGESVRTAVDEYESARPRRHVARGTPTSSKCCCRRSNTGTSVSNECRAGSTRRSRA